MKKLFLVAFLYNQLILTDTYDYTLQLYTTRKTSAEMKTKLQGEKDSILSDPHDQITIEQNLNHFSINLVITATLAKKQSGKKPLKYFIFQPYLVNLPSDITKYKRYVCLYLNVPKISVKAGKQASDESQEVQSRLSELYCFHTSSTTSLVYTSDSKGQFIGLKAIKISQPNNSNDSTFKGTLKKLEDVKDKALKKITDEGFEMKEIKEWGTAVGNTTDVFVQDVPRKGLHDNIVSSGCIFFTGNSAFPESDKQTLKELEGPLKEFCVIPMNIDFTAGTVSDYTEGRLKLDI